MATLLRPGAGDGALDRHGDLGRCARTPPCRSTSRPTEIVAGALGAKRQDVLGGRDREDVFVLVEDIALSFDETSRRSYVSDQVVALRLKFSVCIVPNRKRNNIYVITGPG